MKAVISALALIASLAAWSAPARTQERFKVHIGHVSTLFDYAPVWMAVRQGYLRDEGLDVAYTVTGSVPKTAQGLEDGSFDVAITVPEGIVSGIEKGGATRLIAGLTHKVAASLIVAPDIRTVADLKGKRLDVSGLKEGTGLLMLEMVAQHGLEPSDVELKVVGVGGDRWRALQAGEIEAGLQNVPLNLIAIEKGFRNLGDAPDRLPDYQFLVVAARGDWLDRNPDVAAGLLRALIKGRDEVYRNGPLAAELAADNMKISPDLARKTWEFYAKHQPHDPSLAINPGAFRKTLETMTRADLLPAGRALTPERYVDGRHLAAAHRTLRR